MTVDEARARLGRVISQKAAYKSAWSSPPPQPPGYEPREPDMEYVLEAARWRPSPPGVTKSKKAAPAVTKSYGAQLNEMLAALAAIPGPGSVLARYGSAPQPQPPVAKQLTGPERAMVTEFERRLRLVEHDPAKADGIRRQIAQITGQTYYGGV